MVTGSHFEQGISRIEYVHLVLVVHCNASNAEPPALIAGQG